MRAIIACAFLLAWTVVVFAEEPNRAAKADKLVNRTQPTSDTTSVYAPEEMLPQAEAKQNLFKYKWRSHQ
jgi:hypothetical protein